MQTFEYSLQLCTGETLDVCEISLGALDNFYKKAFDDPKSFLPMSKVIVMCTMVGRPVLEDAKIGHTKPLEKLLRTPPAGALVKLDRPVCLHIGDCAMADPKKCTAKFQKFPECWDYSLPGNEKFDDNLVAAQQIVKIIVMAWRDKKYVIISD